MSKYDEIYIGIDRDLTPQNCKSVFDIQMEHILDKHCDKDFDYLMDRIIVEDKSTTSSFKEVDEDELYEFITYALQDECDKVAYWGSTKKYDPSFQYQIQYYNAESVANIVTYNKETGMFDIGITDEITIELVKNPNSISSHGIYVSTMYPSNLTADAYIEHVQSIPIEEHMQNHPEYTLIQKCQFLLNNKDVIEQDGTLDIKIRMKNEKAYLKYDYDTKQFAVKYNKKFYKLEDLRFQENPFFDKIIKTADNVECILENNIGKIYGRDKLLNHNLEIPTQNIMHEIQR